MRSRSIAATRFPRSVTTDLTDQTPDASPPRWLFWTAVALLVSTFWLILWGGYTNSFRAGMAFPDWPTSDGHLVYLLPWSEWGDWSGQRFWEHSHRLIASGLVGPLTVVLLVGALRSLRPGPTRSLAAWAMIAVVLQGLLGGLTVKASLSIKALSIAHGAAAQIFVALVAALATRLSCSFWERSNKLPVSRAFALLPACLFVQTVLGAIYRHTESTMALMIHVAGALVVGLVIGWVALAILTFEEAPQRLKRSAIVALGILGVQLVLGVFAWIKRIRTVDVDVIPWDRAHVASIHVLIGSVLVALSIYIWIHTRPSRLVVA